MRGAMEKLVRSSLRLLKFDFDSDCHASIKYQTVQALPCLKSSITNTKTLEGEFSVMDIFDEKCYQNNNTN